MRFATPRTLLAALVGACLVLVSVQAGAELGQQTAELYPPGQHDHPVTLGFTGEVYTGDSWFADLEKTPEGLTPAEKFLLHAIEVNRTGTADEVLELWQPSERAEIRPLVTNPDLFQKNQAFYRRITDSALLARILYGDYVLFFVQHQGPGLNGLVKVYPVVTVDGHAYLTNQLQTDPVYQYLSTAYRSQLPRKEPHPSAGTGHAP